MWPIRLSFTGASPTTRRAEVGRGTGTCEGEGDRHLRGRGGLAPGGGGGQAPAEPVPEPVPFRLSSRLACLVKVLAANPVTTSLPFQGGGQEGDGDGGRGGGGQAPAEPVPEPVPFRLSSRLACLVKDLAANPVTTSLPFQGGGQEGDGDGWGSLLVIQESALCAE
jgi:hypothetical protein